MHSSPQSLPLQIAGFLAGDTIHVNGEAGNIRFSGQFQITHNESPSSTPSMEFPEKQSSQIPPFSAASLLSCISQNQPRHAAGDLTIRPVVFPDLDKPEYDATPADLDQNQGSTRTLSAGNEEAVKAAQTPEAANSSIDHPSDHFSAPGKPELTFQITPHGCDRTPPCPATQGTFPTNVKTRLRSGTIQRINYFPPAIKRIGMADYEPSLRSSVIPMRSPDPMTRMRRRRRYRTGDAAERILRRHCLPIRPCNAYTFFVIANWGRINRNSFQETSRRLADMWRELPHCDKNEYEELGWKDRKRYRRQAELLKRLSEEFAD